jgi:aspartate/methionine/tyrosine aminotransferase
LQAALASAFSTIEEGYFEELRRDYTRRRALLIDALKRTGLKAAVPRGTYYILADFSEIWEGDDRSFVHHLIEHRGVAAIPPSSFYTRAPDEGKKLVRFAFCKRLDTLEQATERLKDFSIP